MSERAFFAGPEEQRRWLSLLLREDVWCVSEFLGPTGVSSLGPEQVHDLVFESGPSALQLFLGRRDLAPVPCWRPRADGRTTIDFARSRAVQYVPCTRSGDVLVEGR